MRQRKQSIGTKLRKIRNNRKETIREVAMAIGVSESLISQIEHGKVSPSLDTLLAMINHLDADFDYIFEDFKKNRNLIVVRDGECKKIDFGGFKYEYLASVGHEDDLRAIGAFVITIPANAFKVNNDTHDGFEFIYILSGMVEVVYDGKKILLHERDSVTFDAQSPHELRNPTDEICKVLWIVTPPRMIGPQ